MKKLQSIAAWLFLFGAGLVQGADDCPPVSTIENQARWELGTGRYTARQQDGIVTVTAAGQHSTAGYKTQLARDPAKSYPPKLILYRQPPDGPAAQVITPFTVCATFKASRPVNAIVVRDREGEHRVTVESR